MSAPVRTPDADKLSPEARRSIIGGIVSLLMDSYDIYLPALVLPAAMAYFEPASMPATVKVTLVTLIFAVTLLARPIGGPIFGNLSDKVGRKRTTMMAGFGFTITTLLIALMPGYATWGIGAIVALIVLRLIDGVFLGGGYAGPVPLALERTPKQMRGLVSGLISAGAPVAIIFISLVQLVVLSRIPAAAYESWGWRLPFLFGVLLGVFYLYYFSRVAEMPVPKRPATARQPLAELLTGSHLRDLAQVFLLMSGMWFAAQMALSFLPSLLIGILHQSAANVSSFEIVANVATGGAMILFAVWSQRIGRRRFLIGAGIAIAIFETLAFWLMVVLARDGASFLAIGALAFVAFVLANGPLGTVVVYLVERFPMRMRGSAYGTAYTVSLILPSLYSIWLAWLGNVMPYEFTALVLIALGGILFTWAALIGPETRDVGLLEGSDQPEEPGQPRLRKVVGH